MSAEFQIVLHVVAIGVGATILLDLWSACLKLFFQMPSTNWAMVGRWFGNFPRGQLVHDKIAVASPVRGELLLGLCRPWLSGYSRSSFHFSYCSREWASASQPPEPQDRMRRDCGVS